MTKNQERPFEWREVADIFCIPDDECTGECRECLVARINGFSDRFGREYVIRKIALRHQAQRSEAPSGEACEA
jgi:hypothetical protein